MQGRASVVAVYALDAELARVAPSVSQPKIGEIRLAWWRERIEAIAAGEPAPGETVLQALAPFIASGRAPISLFEAMIEARHADLDPAPFADDAALARHLDGTAGAVMGLAARALDAQAPLQTVVAAGRAWGLAELYQTRAAWRTAGRRWTPASWGDPDEVELAVRVGAEVRAALAQAGAELAALPVGAFPAVAYVTLARSYARGHPPGELARRLRLLRATLTGRI